MQPTPLGTVSASHQMVMWPIGPVKVLLSPVLDGTETPEEHDMVFHSAVTQLDVQNNIIDPSTMVITLLHIMQSTQVGQSERKDWLTVLEEEWCNPTKSIVKSFHGNDG